MVSDTTEKIIKNTWQSNKFGFRVVIALYMFPVSIAYGLYKWYKGELKED